MEVKIILQLKVMKYMKWNIKLKKENYKIYIKILLIYPFILIN